MGKRGRLYSPEFKEEAVRLVHSSDERYPVAKIARDLDVSTETLRKGVKMHRYAYLSSTTTSSVDFYAPRDRERQPPPA
jgi:transposase-like protein